MVSVRELFSVAKPDLTALLQAIRAGSGDDSLTRFVTENEWIVLAGYLDVEDVPRGHILTAKGALDRTVYFLESGTLRVHYGTEAKGYVVATLRPGAVVGEGAFFSEMERNATVQALSACRVWSLTPARFAQLRKEHTEVALSLVMALGATVASRMLDVTKRAVLT